MGRRKGQTRVAWDAVDWSMSDSMIARRFDVSRERVRQVRKERKIGEAPLKGQHEAAVLRRRLLQQTDVSSFTNQELALAFGVNPATITALLKEAEAGPTYHANRLYPWSVIDWSKPNREIAEALGCHEVHVANNRRRYAPETVGTFPTGGKTYSPYDWTAVDWSKRNVDIARELGCAADTVSVQRKNHAPHTLKQATLNAWKTRRGEE